MLDFSTPVLVKSPGQCGGTWPNGFNAYGNGTLAFGMMDNGNPVSPLGCFWQTDDAGLAWAPGGPKQLFSKLGQAPTKPLLRGPKAHRI